MDPEVAPFGNHTNRDSRVEDLDKKVSESLTSQKSQIQVGDFKEYECMQSWDIPQKICGSQINPYSRSVATGVPIATWSHALGWLVQLPSAPR